MTELACATESLTADVAVVGAGPAGIAAACAAAEAGKGVVLLDEAALLGGPVWRRVDAAHAPREARLWLARLRRSGARVVSEASVVARRADGALVASRGGAPLVVAAARLVVATGARELFLPFPGWTLPGVLGAGGAQSLAKTGGSFRGIRAVVAGSGPLLLPVAATLAKAGARVVAVAEQAPAARLARFVTTLVRFPGRLSEALRYRAAFASTSYRTGTWVAEARGEGRVVEVEISNGLRRRTVPCDLLAVSWGLVPNVELARLLGCAVEGGVVSVDDDQRTSLDGVFAAGEPTGVGGADRALVEGEIAGLAASGAPIPSALRARRSRLRSFAAALDRAFVLRPETTGLARPDTLVCRCEDVPLAALDGVRSAREAKLHRRVGMGACQGRICGPALHILRGFEADTVRPPLVPVPLSVLTALQENDR